MRYILLIYQNTEAWNAMSREDKEVLMSAAGDIVQELTASGELVGGEGLADASQARSTRVRDGVVTVTDGPFLEAKEYLGGFYLIDVEDKARALELAAQIPDAAIDGLGVEVRQVMFSDGQLEA
jgi:hypothetical protein